jgi:hypothetical protein
MKKDRWHKFVFVLISVIIIIGSLYPNIVEWYRTPPNTTYSFSYNHTGDFNLVLYCIKGGIEGHLLYKIPYTDQNVMPLVLHPLYFLAGFVFSPISKSPVVILYILRIISLTIFLACLYKLVATAFTRFIFRLTAFVVALCSTSFWTQDTNGVFTIPLWWNDTFYAFRKFIVLPHHLLPMAAFMLLIVTFVQKPWTKRMFIIASILTLIIGFIHPYRLLSITIIVFVYGVILWLIKPSQRKTTISIMASFFIPAVLVYGYYAVTTTRAYPWMQQNSLQALLSFHQTTPFLDCLKSFGLTGILSILFLIPAIHKKINNLFFLLLLWALIPIVLFQFADIGIMESLRTHQYIPLALLGTRGLEYLINRRRLFYMLIPIVIGGTILYFLPPYLAALRMAHEEHFENYFNIYIPDYLTRTFAYLNKQTPNQSVVLAGATVSYMIPAFTHNFVFIGQGDSVPDYPARVMSVVNFFNQQMDPDTMKTYLYSHHISYILFTIDAPAYDGNFPKLPFLKEVYSDGFSSIVRVLPQ